MRLEESCSLNEKIEPYLLEKIKDLSLEEILEGFLEIIQEYELFFKTLEKEAELALDNINLEKLLQIRQDYKRLLSKKKFKTLTDKLDNSLTQLFEEEKEKAKVDYLIISIIIKYYDDKLFEQLFKPLFEENTSKIINRFKLSSSFDNAASNAKLLNEAADFISLAQWEEIIKAFF